MLRKHPLQISEPTQKHDPVFGRRQSNIHSTPEIDPHSMFTFLAKLVKQHSFLF